MAAFGFFDYFVLGVVLLISVGIGVYYRFTGNRQKSSDEFLLASRSMSVSGAAITQPLISDLTN
jgi:sodium-coupled monocarboxylate transporter 8/12